MAEAAYRRSHNRLLDLLPNGERTNMLAHMQPRSIVPHELIQPPGQPIRTVYFPLSGVVSLMTPLGDGSAIETATVGREGMVGVGAFLGGGTLGNAQAMSQVPGEMLSMNAGAFRSALDGDVTSKLRTVMLAYTQALFAQIGQAVACNGVHEIPQRTAKWLLETHDRAVGDEFELTQEFLADMLGVTRPSVSVAAHTLQAAGLITYRRGSVTVLDRQGLEEASCECYATVHNEYERLMNV